MKAIIGKKLGMSQKFDTSTGKATSVTLLDVSDSKISNVYSKDGFNFVEFGFGKKKNAIKSLVGQYVDLGSVPQFKKSVKIEGESEYKIGDTPELSIFSEGDIVDVSGISKGKGFQGVMKRHGFKGGQRTHGQSDRQRSPGSIGAGTTPGRVVKGKKMAGRMGRENVTIKNLKIVHIDVENSILGVSGAIPGNKGGYIFIELRK